MEPITAAPGDEAASYVEQNVMTAVSQVIDRILAEPPPIGTEVAAFAAQLSAMNPRRNVRERQLTLPKARDYLSPASKALLTLTPQQLLSICAPLTTSDEISPSPHPSDVGTSLIRKAETKSSGAAPPILPSFRLPTNYVDGAPTANTAAPRSSSSSSPSSPLSAAPAPFTLSVKSLPSQFSLKFTAVESSKRGGVSASVQVARREEEEALQRIGLRKREGRSSVVSFRGESSSRRESVQTAAEVQNGTRSPSASPIGKPPAAGGASSPSPSFSPLRGNNNNNNTLQRNTANRSVRFQRVAEDGEEVEEGRAEARQKRLASNGAFPPSVDGETLTSIERRRSSGMDTVTSSNYSGDGDDDEGGFIDFADQAMLLDKCGELPVFVGDFPSNDEQLKVMIYQLAKLHEMRHISFVVASTPSVAVQLEDGFVYRAEVGAPLWNLATRQLVEEVLLAQDPNIATVDSEGKPALNKKGRSKKAHNATAAPPNDESPENEKDDLGSTAEAFGSKFNSRRVKAEKAADLLSELGVDPSTLAEAEYEENDRARRVDNARRRNSLRSGLSKLKNLVENVMENRRRTREQIAQGLRVARSKADILLGSETINTNALLLAIDDEKLETALIKYLFPAVNNRSETNAKSASEFGVKERRRSSLTITTSPIRRRSLSLSDQENSDAAAADAAGTSPISKSLSHHRKTSRSLRSFKGLAATNRSTSSAAVLSKMQANASQITAKPSPKAGAAAAATASTTNTSAASPTSSLMLNRSKSFGLAETALRAAKERRAEDEIRQAMSVTSALMALRDATRAFAHENPTDRVIFKYSRIFHPAGIPISQRATDRLFEVMSAIPKEHDACVVILGFGQSLLMRHMATLASIYYKIVREVQTVSRAFTLYDSQERIHTFIDVDLQRRRLSKTRAERDQRRAVLQEALRPKIRAIEQVESPQECKARLEKARFVRNQRIERRQRNDEALTAIDIIQQYNAAVAVQSVVRGFLARRRVRRLIEEGEGFGSTAENSNSGAFDFGDDDGAHGGRSRRKDMTLAQLVYKEFREGKNPFFRNCVEYLHDALGPDSIALKTPSRSFNRTLLYHEKRRMRVPPQAEDDVSSEDEIWAQRSVTQVIPGTTCAINPTSSVLQALQAAGNDDGSFLIEAIAEYGHVEPMQRKASSVLEKLVQYIMFGAFASLRIKLEFGYAATPGTLASSVFLQIPSRFQPINTFSDWSIALPLPSEWARQFSIIAHAFSSDPAPLLSHRMLLGGPLPNGAWIADEPDEENPAVAAAIAKAAKEAKLQEERAAAGYRGGGGQQLHSLAHLAGSGSPEGVISTVASSANHQQYQYQYGGGLGAPTTLGRNMSMFASPLMAKMNNTTVSTSGGLDAPPNATLQRSSSRGGAGQSFRALPAAKRDTLQPNSLNALALSNASFGSPPSPSQTPASNNKDDYCIICPRRVECYDASANPQAQAPIFITPEFLTSAQWEEVAKALLKGDMSILGKQTSSATTRGLNFLDKDGAGGGGASSSAGGAATVGGGRKLSPQSRRFNRVVWVSTCPHPCVLVNGIPFYAPERKSSYERHRINNPKVIDARAESLKKTKGRGEGENSSAQRMGDGPLCLSTLTSYASPACVPPPRSIRSLVLLGRGGDRIGGSGSLDGANSTKKSGGTDPSSATSLSLMASAVSAKGALPSTAAVAPTRTTRRPQRTAILMSETPLLSYGVSRCDRPMSLPNRLLTPPPRTTAVTINSSLPPHYHQQPSQYMYGGKGSTSSRGPHFEKNANHIYLSELEAALIAELVEKVPENGGHIYYHPANPHALDSIPNAAAGAGGSNIHQDPLSLLRGDPNVGSSPLPSTNFASAYYSTSSSSFAGVNFDAFGVFKPYWEIPKEINTKQFTRVSQRDRNGVGGGGVADDPLLDLFGELGYDVLWGASLSVPVSILTETIVSGTETYDDAVGGAGGGRRSYSGVLTTLGGVPPNIRRSTMAVEETTNRFGLRMPSPMRLRVIRTPASDSHSYGANNDYNNNHVSPHVAAARDAAEMLHGAVGAVGAAASMIKSLNASRAANHNNNQIISNFNNNPNNNPTANLLLAPLLLGTSGSTLGNSGVSTAASPDFAASMSTMNGTARSTLVGLPNRRGRKGAKQGMTPIIDPLSPPPPPTGGLAANGAGPFGLLPSGVGGAFGIGLTQSDYFLYYSSLRNLVPLGTNGGVHGGASIRYAAIAAANRLPKDPTEVFTSLPAVAARIRRSLREIVEERYVGGGNANNNNNNNNPNGKSDEPDYGALAVMGNRNKVAPASASRRENIHLYGDEDDYGGDDDDFIGTINSPHSTAKGSTSECYGSARSLNSTTNTAASGGKGGGGGGAAITSAVSHASLSPAAAAAASASSGTIGLNCFRYHRVPLKYGHMFELVTVLGDLYELLVANADEPKTAFVFGISDPVKSQIAAIAATVVYDVDLRRSYQRAEMSQNEAKRGEGGGGSSGANTPIASSLASPKLSSGNNTDTDAAPLSARRANHNAPHKSSGPNASSGSQPQPQLPLPLPKRPESTKPCSLEMFPFLARIADENVGIEINRAAQTLDEILIDCKAYDAIIGDAARSVFYAVLSHLPDEASLMTQLNTKKLRKSMSLRRKNASATAVTSAGRGSQAWIDTSAGTVDDLQRINSYGLGNGGGGERGADGDDLMGQNPPPLSPRSRREAERLAAEAEAEAAEEQKVRDEVMSLPQLRYCKRVLLGWLEALKPEGWNNYYRSSEEKGPIKGETNKRKRGVDDVSSIAGNALPACHITVVGAEGDEIATAGGEGMRSPRSALNSRNAANRLKDLQVTRASSPSAHPTQMTSPRPVTVPDPSKIPKTPSATQNAAITPFGPIIPLEEASRRFEQYVTLVLFVSFVRLSCDARRVNAATGRPLPRFEDHVFPQPVISSLLYSAAARSPLNSPKSASSSVSTPKPGAQQNSSNILGMGASVAVNQQLVESLRYGVDIWEGPLRLTGEALENPDMAPSSGLFSPRGSRRGRGASSRNSQANAAVAAQAAEAAQKAIEKLNVTNCCVEDDPSLRRANRPLHQEDLIDLSVMAGGHLLVNPKLGLQAVGAGSNSSFLPSPMGGLGHSTVGSDSNGAVRGRSRSRSPAGAAVTSKLNTSEEGHMVRTNTLDPLTAAAKGPSPLVSDQSLLRLPLVGGELDADDEANEDSDGSEPWEEVVHPLSTAAAALARPVTVFDLEYEGTRLWKRVQNTMHVLR